jgi:hypothetical protein
MDLLKHKFNIKENAANDMASALFNYGIYVGESIGPILGGSISNFRGFESACYYMSFMNIFYVFLYYLINRESITDYYSITTEEKREVKIEPSKRLRNSSIDNVALGNRIRSYSISSAKHKP